MFVCPRTKGALDGLYSPQAGVTYPTIDGIPVLVDDPKSLLSSLPRFAQGFPDIRRLNLPDPLTPHLPPSMLGVSQKSGLGRWFGEIGENSPDAVAAAMAIRRAPAGPALDVGCGVGVMARLMAVAGRSTWAMDLLPDAVAFARGLLTGQMTQAAVPTHRTGFKRIKVPFRPITQNLNFCIADAANPPFPSRFFAWVHLGNVLDGAGDAAGAILVHCSELLIPGGILTITTAYDTPGEPSEDGPKPEDELKEAARELNLDIVEHLDRVPGIQRDYDRSYHIKFFHCIAAQKR